MFRLRARQLLAADFLAGAPLNMTDWNDLEAHGNRRAKREF
jgi:hypothetical protein